MSIVDSEAVRLAACLRMHKFIYDITGLNQVATDFPHKFVKIVLRELCVTPERDIFVAAWVF